MGALTYINLRAGDPPPADALPRPFRVVIVSEQPSSEDWRNQISAWLISIGCLYLIAWGRDCAAWEDAVDWANLEKFDFGDIPEADFIPTTCHADEALSEAFWFAGQVAFHSTVPLPDALILHIAPAEKRTRMLTAYREAQTMDLGPFRFDRFQLDPEERLLTLDGAPVELNARYLDALTLLVREAGKLVSKDRFLEEVWRGVPVTDEALTQCIRTLRRQLGDDAARPRFIETVPKHGYRFIAPLEAVDEVASPLVALTAAPAQAWREVLLTVVACAGGGAAAGGFGGLFYGFAGAAQSQGAGMGSSSVLAVMVSVCLLTGLVGGLGVGAGIAAFNLPKVRPWYWSLIGGAVGGMVIGAVVKLLGLDAFNLLFGRAPDQIAGGFEGMILGGATGLAAGLIRYVSQGRALAVAAVLGALAGLAITALNGRLMAGSLDALARQFPDSRLSLQPLGKLFGEASFGLMSRIGTAGLEGALFAACIVGAILYARRKLP